MQTPSHKPPEISHDLFPPIPPFFISHWPRVMSSEAPKEDTPARAPEERWFEWYGHEIIRAYPHENLDEYKTGGFHPAELGDTLQNGRYTIRHKISFGGSSIVWLARDAEEERWVSIKIKKARYSTPEIDNDPEVKSLRALENHFLSTPQENPRCFAPLLDCFQHKGPSGTHNCLVLEFLGPSINHMVIMFGQFWKEDKWDYQGNFWPSTVLRSSRQLLEAIEFIEDAGIVHGDISPGNVVFTCYEHITTDEALWELMGQPDQVPYCGEEPKSPHLPKHLVSRASFSGWGEDGWEDIRIVDWHGSFPVDEPRCGKDVPQNRSLFSPENFFASTLGPKHDFWGAGCVIYYLFFQELPFSYMYTDYAFLESIIRKLGPLPEGWQARWEEMRNENGEVSHQLGEVQDDRRITTTFEPRRESIMKQMEEEEEQGDYEKGEYEDDDFEALKGLLGVMMGLLRYEPEKRMSVPEALQCIQWIDHQRESTPADAESRGASEDDCNSVMSEL
ncbi:kinase-like domain-containing protein [Thelonectria olida]|uniref:EKC/KEOPS complex subunit BUD32 n=1 Tax=Thelonectria olida TaxID=1576542 RepID=A0A9P8VXP9_9HYPO|nr:kinase-like domain-containing protein [Thelonectria olida]